MPRTIWKGALSFGLVNIPVGLYPATSDKSIHFNQFEEGTSDRIRYKKVNERTGEEVPQDRIVRGFDLGGGEYVVLSEEELETAEPKKSRQVEISDFVEQADIDPVYFRSSYYLAPEGAGADKAYALLRKAMADAGKVAIATLVMRNKEYLVAIRPEDDSLALHTMYFADEVRAPGRDLELPDTGDVSDRELSMAQLLIESMESDWDPERYHDTHREKVEALVEEKRSGHEIVVQAGPEPAAKVVDLMEALNASIAAAAGTDAKGTKRSPTAKRAPAGRAAPAKKGQDGQAAGPGQACRPPQGVLSIRAPARPLRLVVTFPSVIHCVDCAERTTNRTLHSDPIRFPAPDAESWCDLLNEPRSGGSPYGHGAGTGSGGEPHRMVGVRRPRPADLGRRATDAGLPLLGSGGGRGRSPAA